MPFAVLRIKKQEIPKKRKNNYGFQCVQSGSKASHILDELPGSNPSVVHCICFPQKVKYNNCCPGSNPGVVNYTFIFQKNKNNKKKQSQKIKIKNN